MSEDFSKGKRGPVISAGPGKVRITIRLDADIINHFKSKVLATGGGNYQTMINAALREYVIRDRDVQELEEVVRRVVREELHRIAG